MAFTLVADSMIVMGDTSNTKPAVVLKGGDTDDALEIDELAIAQTAANDTAGTISAWVNPGDITSTMAIVSFNDANVVEYIDFKIVAGKLTCAVNDATVAQWTVVSDAVVCPAHKWTHVAIVQDGVAPRLYVDGVAVAQTYSTSTDLTDWFNSLDGIDKGWIGASSIGGAGAVGEEFVGAIADVKYYATAHTADEIYQDYFGNVKAGSVAWYKLNLSLVNSGSEGTAAAIVSDAYLTPSYNEFISYIRYMITAQGTVVAGDCVGMSNVNGIGTALFINVA
jgi:hypothetical protein